MPYIPICTTTRQNAMSVTTRDVGYACGEVQVPGQIMCVTCYGCYAEWHALAGPVVRDGMMCTECNKSKKQVE
jgi:hypothetical protein